MTNLTNAGRWIGGAVLAGYILDISSNFFLQPMIRNGTGAMGLFGGAAEQPGLISLIVLIGMVSGVISLIWAALLCQLSTARPFAWLAFLYLGLKASSFGMGGSEIASYSIFRSIGDAMLAAPGSDLAKLAEPIWTLVTSQRDGLHFPHMLLGGTGAFVFYVILYQSRWIPRWLATAGLLATASQMTGVFTGVLFGEVIFYFLAPLALVQLVVGLWLVWRGFVADPASEDPALRQLQS
jgi:hypothetical protein